MEEELEEDTSKHDIQNPRGSSIPLEAVEEGRNVEPSSPISRSNNLPYARSASPKPKKASISFPLSHPNGGVGPVKGDKGERHWTYRLKEGTRQTLQMVTNPVFAQAFILTFLGEWGDRSQITTIAMGGAHVGSFV